MSANADEKKAAEDSPGQEVMTGRNGRGAGTSLNSNQPLFQRLPFDKLMAVSEREIVLLKTLPRSERKLSTTWAS